MIEYIQYLTTILQHLRDQAQLDNVTALSNNNNNIIAVHNFEQSLPSSAYFDWTYFQGTYFPQNFPEFPKKI